MGSTAGRNANYPREARALRALLMAGRREEGQRFGRVRRGARGRGWRVDVRPFGWIHSLAGVGFGERRHEAKLVLRKIRARVDQGMSAQEAVAPFLPISSNVARVATHYAAWLDARRRELALERLSPRTVHEYERYARSGGELDFWHGRTIYDVDGPALEEWSLWLAERGLAPKTVRNVLGAFRTFVRYLQRRGELERAPLFPVVQVPEHLPQVLALEDQARILAAIPALERGAHLVAATMGLRPGEVRALRPADYAPARAPGDLARLHVRHARQGHSANAPLGPTKTRRERALPVPEIVSAWIDEHVKPKERLKRKWLFVNPRTRKAWSHRAFRASWLRGCKAAGLGAVPFYEGTKHTFASAALERCGSAEVVANFLGHTDTRTTRRYAKVGERALVELVRR